MTKTFADTGAAKIAYTIQGEGTPVVLLHGFCGSSAYWDEVVPLLAHSVRVVVPDLRGHGDSSTPAGPYTIEDIADDIAGLIDTLGAGRAVVLGHSLGGYAALALAERAPDKLLGFGLIHSTAYPDDEKGKEGRGKAIQTIREQGLPAFLDGLVPRLFAPAHVESMPEAVRKAKEVGLQTSPEGAIHTLGAMLDRPDRNEVLRSAELPILLVAGTGDQVIPPERTLEAQGERIVHKRIDGAGHMSMVEAPGELAETILSFVKTI